MNNIYNLDDLSLENANDNSEVTLEPNPSQTLEALSEATSKSAMEVISSKPTLQNATHETQSALAEQTRLSGEIEAMLSNISQSINESLPGLSSEKSKFILNVIESFQNKEDIDRVISQSSHLNDEEKSEMISLVENLETESKLEELHNLKSESNTQQQIVKDSISRLLERNTSVIKSEYFRRKLIQSTGLYFGQNVSANLELSYVNEEGQESTFPLEVKGFQANQNNPLLEIEYQDPISGAEVNSFISPAEFKNILLSSKAVSKSITSVETINRVHDFEALGISIQPGAEIEYKASNDQTKVLTVSELSDDKVLLSDNIYVNGESKHELSLSEFSKWLNLHSGSSKINNQQLNQAVNKLHDLYKAYFSPSHEVEQTTFTLQPNSIFKTINTNAEIIVNEVGDNEVKYTYSGAPASKTNSQFLQLLSNGAFLPFKDESETTHSSNDSSEDDSDSDDPPSDPNHSLEGNTSSNIIYGGVPALLKPGTYTRALSSVLTLGGNIVWLSYDDVAKELIPKIVDNIKSSLEISNKRKLGALFKDTPLIGEEFARMESGAKKEIVEDATKTLERLGDWRKVKDIICTTDNIFEFIAATNFLKDKGYLPTFDERYLKNVQKFSASVLGKDFEIPTPIQKNRSIVDKNLISFYDDLLDPGDGVRTINTNKSNKDSAVQEYKRQSSEIFSENPDWGLTRLHRIIEGFSNGEDVDPHEYEGYLLGAYDSGEVNEVDLLTYIALGRSVKDKNGDTLVKGYEGLLAPLKKEFIGFNLFLDGSQGEFISFFSENILDSNGNVPTVPKGMDRANLEQRFGEAKAKKIQNFIYWTSLSKTTSKKQNSYLKERQVSKDFAGYSLFTHDYTNLKKDFVFVPRTSNSSLTSEQVTHGIKVFPSLIESYSNVLSEGSNNYINSERNYPFLEEKIKNVIFSYILVEGAYTGRVEPGGNSRVGDTLSPDSMADTSDNRDRSKAMIRSILTNINGISSEEVDELFADYKGDQAFVDKLEAVMSKASSHELVESLKKLQT